MPITSKSTKKSRLKNRPCDRNYNLCLFFTISKCKSLCRRHWRTNRRRAKCPLVLETHVKLLHESQHTSVIGRSAAELRPLLHLHAIAWHAGRSRVRAVHARCGTVHHRTGSGRQHQLRLICHNTQQQRRSNFTNISYSFIIAESQQR